MTLLPQVTSTQNFAKGAVKADTIVVSSYKYVGARSGSSIFVSLLEVAKIVQSCRSMCRRKEPGAMLLYRSTVE